MLGTLRAEDVCPVGNEALAHQGALAHGADKAVIVPVSIFKGDEAGATNASDGLGAGCASLGEQFPEAVGAVGLVIPGSEALASQRSATVSAGEAFPMPRFALVGHASRRDDLVALDAARGELVLVAGSAVDVLVPGYEALGPNWGLAHAATETLFMPLPGLVLHLLVACPEDFPTSVASGGELSIIAGATKDLLQFGTKLFIHK